MNRRRGLRCWYASRTGLPPLALRGTDWPGLWRRQPLHPDERVLLFSTRRQETTGMDHHDHSRFGVLTSPVLSDGFRRVPMGEPAIKVSWKFALTRIEGQIANNGPSSLV